MGWFSTENFITNNVATEELRLIAIGLIALTGLIIVFFMFRAYNSHIKTHVKNVATREITLNNVSRM